MQNKKMLRNTAWYFGGTVISAILGLIASPILTRVLSTKVYAQYGIVTTFTTLAATFIYMGQDEAFMRYFNRRADSYKAFLWKCMKFPLMLCVVMLFVLLEPQHIALKWIFDTEISTIVALLLAVYIAVTVIQRFLMITARMEERAANYSISNIATKLMFIVAVFLILKMFGKVDFDGIIISLITGVIFALGVNIIVILTVSHGSNPEGETISSKELLKFGLPFAFSNTALWAIPMLEKIVIRDLTSWDVLAVYTSASIFVTAINLIKTTVNSIWVPYVYKKYENEEHFKIIFHNIGILMCWLCVCILAGLIFFRRWVVLIFDSAYYDCRLIAPALVCGAFFDLLTCIYSIGINIRKKTVYLIIFPVVQIIISIGFLYFCLPRLGLVATGISYLLSIAASRGLQIIIALHYYGTGRGYAKLAFMMGLYTVVGILSCFFSSLQFDVICGIALFIIGSATVWKELAVAYKWLFPKKNNGKNKNMIKDCAVR